MASIIEKYASEDVTLLQGPVISDGKTTFENSISAKAIVSDDGLDGPHGLDGQNPGKTAR